MAEDIMGVGALGKEVLDWVAHIGSADILVGIPSYNNARTIGRVVQAVQAGLAKYFPRKKSVLVNSDGGSSDGTTSKVNEAVIHDLSPVLVTHRARRLLAAAFPYHGMPGKGSAFRTIFEIAKALQVKACAVVDSDLRSITPEWIELLIKPVLDGGFDYVAPLYRRHKYDGTITNGIIYPLTRALYGKRVRQPIGGDFGFSGGLAAFFSGKDVWETDVARYGIDIWMTTTALANNFKVCQSFLGAKIHDPKDPAADLSTMLVQVVGSAFQLMEEYAGIWKERAGSEPVPSFGFRYEVGVEPVNVNIERMLERYWLGVAELSGIWEKVLPENVISFLKSSVIKGTGQAGPENFRIPDEIWVRVIYSFALAFHKKLMGRGDLLSSFTPLYIGRTASFVLDTLESGPEEVEDRIEALCLSFEKEKKLLINGWD
jgi:glycosyltransferase involved in cell wall biosynthesis